MISKLVTIGSFLLGIALLGLGTHVLFVSEFAAQGYGVLLAGASPAYLIATGMRDLVLGFMTLGILFRHRDALPLFLICLTLLPIADVVIVLKFGDSLAGIAPHAIGTIGLIILSGLSLHETRQTKA